MHSDSVLHAAVKSRITAPLSMAVCVSHTCLCVLLQLRSFPTRMASCCGQVLCGSMRCAAGAVDPCDAGICVGMFAGVAVKRFVVHDEPVLS